MLAKTILFLFIFIIGFTAPLSAQVRISEIMYDLGGEGEDQNIDKGREWIEIVNSGGEPISLENLRIKTTNSSLHNSKIERGDSVLEAGEYAVFVKEVSAFLIDNPNYNKTLIDSAFDLKNTTDTIFLIKDKKPEVVLDEVTYFESYGANGDSESLHINEAGDIYAGEKTPGEAPPAKGEGANDDSTDDNSTDDNQTTKSSGDRREFADSIIETTPTIGYLTNIPTIFRVIHRDDENERIRYTPTIWNFGDGSVIKTSGEIKYFWRRAGTYVVSTTFDFKREEHTQQKTITVVPPDFDLMFQNGLVSIKNNHPFKINLSDWKIISTLEQFTFPKNTFILGGATITVNKAFAPVNIYVIFSPNNYLIKEIDLRKVTVANIAPQTNSGKEIIKKTEQTEVKTVDEIQNLGSERINADSLEQNVNKNIFSNLLGWLVVLILLIIIAIAPLLIDYFHKTKK